MKKHLIWILIFAALCLTCGFAAILLNRGGSAAVITVDGETVRTVSLGSDCEFDVVSGGGEFNHISVKDGKIAVTDASCPDRLCVRRGYISGGVPIVCLPHRLTVEVTGKTGAVDAVTGR